MFANEVGIGTSAITGAVGEVENPVMQGLTNALSVFIGTFFCMYTICDHDADDWMLQCIRWKRRLSF